MNKNLTIEFSVLPDEIDAKWSFDHPSPKSKLIDKFGEHWLEETKNYEIDSGRKTIISFLDQKGQIWSDTTFTVNTNELLNNHRWEVIDRSINQGVYLCKLYNNCFLDKNDIVKVSVDVPIL